MENKVLLVVDCQNDFITGVLGTPEAQSAIPNIVEKIRNWDGYIIWTCDHHHRDSYKESIEGQSIPFHCEAFEYGAELNADVEEALEHHSHVYSGYIKSTFGARCLNNMLEELEQENDIFLDEIQVIGFCTDICVLSNAIIANSKNDNTLVSVDASCCAGTSPEMHEAALCIMEKNCIKII